MSDSGTPGAPLRALPIVGGLVLGVAVCWVWITLSLFLGFGAGYGLDADVPAFVTVVLASAPVLLGVTLLVPRKTRQLGAGLLMGIAIGFIAGAGICASLIVPVMNEGI